MKFEIFILSILARLCGALTHGNEKAVRACAGDCLKMVEKKKAELQS